MNERILMGKAYPRAYEGLIALDQTIRQSGIDKWHQELIKIRASIINGCAYCVHSHTKDALALGIDPRKITLIPVWKEALNHFTPEEQLIMRLTEEVTLISQHGLSDELYADCTNKFGEALTAQLIMAAIVINAWNRIGVGLKMQPVF
jgi:AhpD family alkylhydroperoxidase